jgi:hypothetical protein
VPASDRILRATSQAPTGIAYDFWAVRISRTAVTHTIASAPESLAPEPQGASARVSKIEAVLAELAGCNGPLVQTLPAGPLGARAHRLEWPHPRADARLDGLGMKSSVQRGLR